MNTWFFVLTLLFIIVSAGMILIILVQRPAGGGLAGAFGGAGGGGTDTVFGGRVGDALTWATVICFLVYLALAIVLNLVPITQPVQATPAPTDTLTSGDDLAPTPPGPVESAPVAEPDATTPNGDDADGAP